MSARSFHRRCTTWLALLAMVFGALAPTVAQAVVASQGGPGWVQVCSASGVVWLRSDAAGGQFIDHSGEPATDASRHCPWCSLHGPAGLPPSAQPQALIEPQFQRPLARVAWVVPATFWPAAPSRGPPLV